jgi:hypothetical protein
MSSDWRVQTEEHFRQYCPEMIVALVKDGGIALPPDVKAAIETIQVCTTSKVLLRIVACSCFDVPHDRVHKLQAGEKEHGTALAADIPSEIGSLHGSGISGGGNTDRDEVSDDGNATALLDSEQSSDGSTGSGEEQVSAGEQENPAEDQVGKRAAVKGRKQKGGPAATGATRARGGPSDGVVTGKRARNHCSKQPRNGGSKKFTLSRSKKQRR